MSQGATVATTSGSMLAEHAVQYGRLYFRLAFGVLRDAAAAEDVCQQAMLKAWERRQELREPQAVRGWIARIVLNESFLVRRRREIERRSLARHAKQSEDAEDPTTHRLAIREAVVAAMEQLPESTRVVVAMRLMQGISGNDVKDLLGCSAGEVSRQLHRGMELLRQSLADWQAD